MDGGASPPSVVDPRSGFCTATRTFHSLRPPVPLPSPSLPLSVTSYSFSLISSSSSPSYPAYVDTSRGGASLSYGELLSQVGDLASSLRLRLGLRRGDVAFVFSHACVEVPVLYFALLSIGAVVSPSKPASTSKEIARKLQLSGPAVAFATSRAAHKLAPFRVATVLFDSPLFRSLLHESNEDESPKCDDASVVRQSDVAAILYSSGTTGLPKAASLIHRGFIAMIAGFHALRREGARDRLQQVTLLSVPLFHLLGFLFLLRGVAVGETTVVVVDRMGLPDMVQAAERHGVTQMTAAPPVLLAMSRWEGPGDLRALECVFSGGAPPPEVVAQRFAARFPGVVIQQGYGTTEGGGIAWSITREECRRYGSVGRLSENLEARVVDHGSGQAVGVGRRGELWVRGPHVMKGYLGDGDANTASFAPGGWLKTGDLCFFDEEGFLFVVDRLKEIIKYKGYQVAPADLEQLLQTLPGVADAAVVPYPHEAAGEVPMAFVVKHKGSSLTHLNLWTFLQSRLHHTRKYAGWLSSTPYQSRQRAKWGGGHWQPKQSLTLHRGYESYLVGFDEIIDQRCELFAPESMSS